MEGKYVFTPNGILKIIEFILLVIGFALVIDKIIEREDAKDTCKKVLFASDRCDIFGAPWEYFIYAVFAIIVAIVILVAFIAHLIMPAWMKLIRAKIAKSEIVSCVVSAVLVLIGSACLASYIVKELEQEVAACVLGFIAFALLLVECAFLYRTANAPSL